MLLLNIMRSTIVIDKRLYQFLKQFNNPLFHATHFVKEILDKGFKPPYTCFSRTITLYKTSFRYKSILIYEGLDTQPYSNRHIVICREFEERIYHDAYLNIKPSGIIILSDMHRGLNIEKVFT